MNEMTATPTPGAGRTLGDLAGALEALGWTSVDHHNDREFQQHINGIDYRIRTNIEWYFHEYADISASLFGLSTKIDFLDDRIWQSMTVVRAAFRAWQAPPEDVKQTLQLTEEMVDAGAEAAWASILGARSNTPWDRQPRDMQARYRIAARAVLDAALGQGENGAGDVE